MAIIMTTIVSILLTEDYEANGVGSRLKLLTYDVADRPKIERLPGSGDMRGHSDRHIALISLVSDKEGARHLRQLLSLAGNQQTISNHIEVFDDKLNRWHEAEEIDMKSNRSFLKSMRCS